jgi:uncharacterized protein
MGRSTETLPADEGQGMKPDSIPTPEEARPSLTNTKAEASKGDLVSYVAPMFVFLGLTSLEGYLPSPTWYPAAYTVKVILVAIAAWYFRSTWSDLRPVPQPKTLALAALIGFMVFVLWVGLDGWYPPLPLLGKRSSFDPSQLGPGAKWTFIVVRLLGLVVLVSLIEELFWRSFLIRWLIDPDFLRVPIGRVTLTAALATSAVFALSHPEWLPALLTGLLWAWLLWKTKSLSACAVSHSVANLALGIYVIATGEWKYW